METNLGILTCLRFKIRALISNRNQTATRIKVALLLNFDAGQRKMVLLDNDAVRDFADLAAVAIADIIAISAVVAAAAASYLVYIVHCYKSPRHHTYGEVNRLSGALVR